MVVDSGGCLAWWSCLGGAGLAWHFIGSAPACQPSSSAAQNRPGPLRAGPNFAPAHRPAWSARSSRVTWQGQAGLSLTFLYTNCPDVCPLIAANLHESYKQLGDQAQNVGILAVTVDPVNDTVDQMRQFSDARGLTDEWSFMTGSPTALDSVWQAYGILAQPVDANGKPISAVAQKQAQGLVPQPSDIEHSAPVFLIDKSGALREMLPVDFTPATLVTDFKILLAEH